MCTITLLCYGTYGPQSKENLKLIKTYCALLIQRSASNYFVKTIFINPQLNFFRGILFGHLKTQNQKLIFFLMKEQL